MQANKNPLTSTDINALRNGVWYLAHPYTRPDPVANVHLCTIVAAYLTAEGIVTIPPIMYTDRIHMAMKDNDLDPEVGDKDFWYKYDEELMKKCDGIILSGDWESSKGCCQEMWWFKGAGKPVYEYKEIKEKLEEYERQH
jgi:nucleoside 2-deoxyribosyltransferase